MSVAVGDRDPSVPSSCLSWPSPTTGSMEGRVGSPERSRVVAIGESYAIEKEAAATLYRPGRGQDNG